MRLSTKDLLSQHWLLLLTGFGLVFFSGFGQTVFIGAHIPAIEESFGLSHAQLSAYYSLATLVSGFLLFFTGKYLDHMALRHFVTWILVGLAAGTFLLAYAPIPLLLFPAFLLLRQCGQGLMGLTNAVSMNRYLENARGRAMALTALGSPLQLVFFPFLAVTMLGLFGWEDSWKIYGIFILAVLLPLFYLLFRHHDRTIHDQWKQAMARSEEVTPDVNAIKQWTRLEAMRDWRLYILVAVMLIDPCFNTAIFYYQAELAASKALTLADIVHTFPVFMVFSVATMYAAGTFLDRFGEKYVLLSFPLAHIAGLCSFAFFDGSLSLYIGMAFMGISMGGMSILGGPLLVKFYGTKNLGSIKTMLNSVFVIASAISPFMTGYLLDSGLGMPTIITGFAAYAFSAWLLMTITLHKRLD